MNASKRPKARSIPRGPSSDVIELSPSSEIRRSSPSKRMIGMEEITQAIEESHKMMLRMYPNFDDKGWRIVREFKEDYTFSSYKDDDEEDVLYFNVSGRMIGAIGKKLVLPLSKTLGRKFDISLEHLLSANGFKRLDPESYIQFLSFCVVLAFYAYGFLPTTRRGGKKNKTKRGGEKTRKSRRKNKTTKRGGALPIYILLLGLTALTVVMSATEQDIYSSCVEENPWSFFFHGFFNNRERTQDIRLCVNARQNQQDRRDERAENKARFGLDSKTQDYILLATFISSLFGLLTFYLKRQFKLELFNKKIELERPTEQEQDNKNQENAARTLRIESINNQITTSRISIDSSQINLLNIETLLGENDRLIELTNIKITSIDKDIDTIRNEMTILKERASKAKTNRQKEEHVIILAEYAEKKSEMREKEKIKESLNEQIETLAKQKTQMLLEKPKIDIPLKSTRENITRLESLLLKEEEKSITLKDAEDTLKRLLKESQIESLENASTAGEETIEAVKTTMDDIMKLCKLRLDNKIKERERIATLNSESRLEERVEREETTNRLDARDKRHQAAVYDALGNLAGAAVFVASGGADPVSGSALASSLQAASLAKGVVTGEEANDAQMKKAQTIGERFEPSIRRRRESSTLAKTTKGLAEMADGSGPSDDESELQPVKRKSRIPQERGEERSHAKKA